MLTIAAAKLCGYQGAGHVRLAAAVEFMHTATLLHDDVVDDSDYRRGKKSARLVWGNQASVLVGDFLLGQAFRMMVDVGSLPALKILSNAAAVIAEGEVMQLAAAKDTATTEDDYMEIIAAKTAALFSAATEVGAAIAGRPAAEQAALKSYGRNLGIAFQLVDDALDYSGDSARLGKSVGDDFREGKITLPVILCFRRGGEAGARVLAAHAVRAQDRGRRPRAGHKLMKKHNAIEATLERARHYGGIARDALAIFPTGLHTRALADVIGFCVSRAAEPFKLAGPPAARSRSTHQSRWAAAMRPAAGPPAAGRRRCRSRSGRCRTSPRTGTRAPLPERLSSAPITGSSRRRALQVIAARAHVADEIVEIARVGRPPGVRLRRRRCRPALRTPGRSPAERPGSREPRGARQACDRRNVLALPLISAGASRRHTGTSAPSFAAMSQPVDRAACSGVGAPHGPQQRRRIRRAAAETCRNRQVLLEPTAPGRAPAQRRAGRRAPGRAGSRRRCSAKGPVTATLPAARLQGHHVMESANVTRLSSSW